MGSNQEQPIASGERFKIQLVPPETLLKFRKDISEIRAGLNFKFHHASIKDFRAKLVLKPLSHNRMWKFVCEPLHHEACLLSKKIPITKFLNIQVGIGHNFQKREMHWKWKFSSSKRTGGDGVSRLRKKKSFGLFPGVDLRFWWKADYALPEYTGLLGMNTAHLRASIDKAEAIFMIDTIIFWLIGEKNTHTQDEIHKSPTRNGKQGQEAIIITSRSQPLSEKPD